MRLTAKRRTETILDIGTETRWGTIVAVSWAGERFYWMKDGCSRISMIDAATVESHLNTK